MQNEEKGIPSDFLGFSKDEIFFEHSVWPIFQWEGAGFATASHYSAHHMCRHPSSPKPGRHLSSQTMIYYGVSLFWYVGLCWKIDTSQIQMITLWHKN